VVVNPNRHPRNLLTMRRGVGKVEHVAGHDQKVVRRAQ
jgi:hypothetical protein